MEDRGMNYHTEADRLLAGRTPKRVRTILKVILWDLFGEVDVEGHPVINPERDCDKVNVRELATFLRREFWPERFPDLDVGRKAPRK
jgi:hypothetical protein